MECWNDGILEHWSDGAMVTAFMITERQVARSGGAPHYSNFSIIPILQYPILRHSIVSMISTA
jgi:hypothetical protein